MLHTGIEGWDLMLCFNWNNFAASSKTVHLSPHMPDFFFFCSFRSTFGINLILKNVFWWWQQVVHEPNSKLAQPHESNHQFCPLALLTPVVGSRLWRMAGGAQPVKAKPQLSSGEGTLFDLLRCLPWKRSYRRCWCAHRGTWGNQSSNHFAHCLHFLGGHMYKVCMEWKGEYVSLHLRPVSIYCSIDRRIRVLSRKCTEEIPNAKTRHNVLMGRGNPFWHTCLNQTAQWLEHWFRCDLTLVRSDWQSSYKRQFLSPLGSACLQSRIWGQKKT